MTTGIGWTEETWNPLAGCEYASPGCRGCYAARDAFGRLRNVPAYAGLAHRPNLLEPPRFTGGIRLLEERMDKPLGWRKGRLVFVNSMSDLFHPGVPEKFIAKVFATMAIASQHRYQILTKRPSRMAQLLGAGRWLDLVDEALTDRGRAQLRHWHPEGDLRELPWMWWGTSIESDDYTFRARQLVRAPAALRFLSLEPLLTDLPSLDLDGIGWVIAGGESGPGARPSEEDWFRRIRDNCADAGIPFFLKQMGRPWARDHGLKGVAKNMGEMPDDLRIQQIPALTA